METILSQAFGQDASQLAAAEKRDLLERLLGRLAHEIRNPLSSLDIHFQLLEEDLESVLPGKSGQMVPRLNLIRGELHRLESIVQHFIRLAGPSALEIERVEVPAILRHVCELLNAEAAVRDIEVTYLAEEVPVISGDRVRLTQALLNLVINALQAVGNQGKVRIQLTREGSHLQIEVADTGPGLPAEKLGTIFDPFYTTKPEGSGLGLWIAQQVIVAHRGTLQARNGASGGAVFTIRLPIQEAQEAQGG